MDNPWKNISWSNTIADCDKNHKVFIGSGKNKEEVLFGSSEYEKFINRNDVDKNGKEAKNPVKLTFDSLPEPFYGDPESEVYCLCMNPGEPDPDFNRDNDEKGGYRYQAYCQAMLNHQPQPKDLIYDRNKNIIVRDANIYDEQMIKILAKIKDFKKDRNHICPRPHVGDVWQREIWKQLIKKLHEEPKVFSLEFFPYHSKSGFPFPADLPSNEYRNDLLEKAIIGEKLIIIMRKTDDWYKIKDRNIGKRLREYPNKIFLRNKQRVWLTPGNFVWEIPEERIEFPDWACHSIKEILEKFGIKEK